MKEWNTTYTIFISTITVVTLSGCIEEFTAESVDFESALVIDATITNELKQQQIYITRTYKLEENGPSGEPNAQVWVLTDDGVRYNFEEIASGTYISTIPFAARPDRDYNLSITTSDGRTYASESARLSGTTKIDSLYAERFITDLGEEGMAIMVDSEDTTNSSKYYRYGYEESYKIVAPEFQPRDLNIVPGMGFVISDRPIEERVCYATNFSNRIVLTNTADLEEARLSRFLVRFINRDNYIISHRYSILVKQYVQSFDVYNFYETLNNFSSSESLFSETQPGFLEGNVFSEVSENEKVLGYFDVSSVDEERIFFNYEDFFPGESLPPYADPCVYGAPKADKLPNMLSLNLIKLITENFPNSGIDPGPYIIVPRVCGDCTALGTPEIPDFWIE